MAQSHTMRSSVRQQGVALIISMILLLVITLIGVAVMGGSRLEWLMANNSHFQSDAAMRADATLRVAESKITGVLGLYNGPWGGAFYDDSPPAPTHPLPYDPSVPANWSLLTKATANTDINAPAGTDNDYLIDRLGCTDATPPPSGNLVGQLFRVWSRSTDSKGTTRISVSVVLQLGGPPSSATLKRIAYAEILP